MAGRYDLGLFLIFSAVSHVALLGGLEAAGKVFWPRDVPAGSFVVVRHLSAASGRDSQQAESFRGGSGRLDRPGDRSVGSAVSLDTRDPVYRPYLRRIKARIRNHWGDPALLPREPHTGALLVEFALERSGELAHLQITESSRVRGFDQAALQAVKEAAPYEPVPLGVPGNTLRVRALFVYD